MKDNPILWRSLVIILALGAGVLFFISSFIMVKVIALGAIGVAVYYFATFEREFLQSVIERLNDRMRRVMPQLHYKTVNAIRIGLSFIANNWKRVAPYVFFVIPVFVIYTSFNPLPLTLVSASIRTIILVAAIALWLVCIITLRNSGPSIEAVRESSVSTRQRWIVIVLVIICIVAFAIRLYAAVHGNIDNDEGIHLSDAKLIIDGFIPFRDYFSREPYYIYLLAFCTRIFGVHLLTSRILSVVASTATIPILYFLGKKISSSRAGLLAGALFGLSPFIIFNTYLGNLYGVYLLITALCFLSLAYLLRNYSVRNAMLSGFLFGASVHFYRLSIFYFPALGFILGFWFIRRSWRPVVAFLASLLIPFAFPLVCFSLYAGYHNFDIMYGTSQLIIGFFSLPIALVLGYYAKPFLTKYSQYQPFILIVVFLLVLILSVLSYFTVGIIPIYKAKILFEAALQSWHIVLFVFLTLLASIGYYLGHYRKILVAIWMILSFLLLSLFYEGVTNAHGLANFGSWILPERLEIFSFLIIALTLPLVWFFLPVSSRSPRPVWIGWWFLFFSPTVFYLIHVQIFTNIFLQFSILGCILAANALIDFYPHTLLYNRRIKSTFIIILVILVALPSYLYLSVPLRDRLLPQQARYEIEKYILTNTQPGEEVYTNLSLFLLETGRRAVANNTRPLIYANGPVSIPNYTNVASNLMPPRELAVYIRDHVRLILMDANTRAIFDTNTDLQEILKYYKPIQQWSRYEVAAWVKI